MSDELSQLDELIESEVLEALGQEASSTAVEENSALQDITTEEDISSLDALAEGLDLGDDITIDGTVPEIQTESSDQEIPSQNASIELSGTNTADLVSVLSQLLNNKTIEITIKIKD